LRNFSTGCQEFETACLLGVDRVFDKRLYVSISRAKQRLFFVGDATAFAKNKTLSRVPDTLYMRLLLDLILYGVKKSSIL
jgi:ATP-dependent exoDNAse (exonuclease V) alpha subunit